MQPLFESLSSTLEAASRAILTVIDREGCVHTRAMRVVPAPFRGRLWLRADRDETPIDKIDRGTEASVSCCASEAGPFVSLSGWATVLRTPRYAKCLPQMDLHSSARASAPLVCVTASAAQMWDTSSAARPRVFAFAHAEPACVEDAVELMQTYARAVYKHSATLERTDY